MGLKIRVLVLGATGMLGNAVFKFFAESQGLEVFGSIRAGSNLRLFPPDMQSKIISGIDVENLDSLTDLFSRVRPNVVVNCIGLVKQLSESKNPLIAVPVNTLLPHRLAKLCCVSEARLIHISTDCVFSGKKGMYTETDFPDADDLYGRSKYLGEVDYPNAITLRTSIIGHELGQAHSLIGWFLEQQDTVRGFGRAVFSGLPTIELARVIRDYVIPHSELHGLYHVSANPINKFELLQLVAKIYRKKIKIVQDDQLVIDRSLDSSRFKEKTGYAPPSWLELVQSMYGFNNAEV